MWVCVCECVYVRSLRSCLWSQAGTIANISSSIVNLGLILLMGRVYTALAEQLTKWGKSQRALSNTSDLSDADWPRCPFNRSATNSSWDNLKHTMSWVWLQHSLKEKQEQNLWIRAAMEMEENLIYHIFFIFTPAPCPFCRNPFIVHSLKYLEI